jgi:hypothetical protein
MKCIIAVKSTKNMEVGTIKRVDDVEAEEKVRVGFFNYISKSEWKKSRGIVEPISDTVGKQFSEKADVSITVKREETISEKQLKRKKQK